MYLNAIKKAARISHNSLDDEITRIEEYACAELIRAGVPDSVITEDNKLIENAVITRALMDLGVSTKTYDNAKASWEYQVDCLRKRDWGDPE